MESVPYDPAAVKRSLEALALDPRVRCQAAVIRQWEAAISQARAQGAPLNEVHKHLVEMKVLQTSYETFKRTLAKIAARRKAATSARPALPDAKPSHPEVNAAPALPAVQTHSSATNGNAEDLTHSSATNGNAEDLNWTPQSLLGPSEIDVARKYFDELRSQGRLPPARKVKDA